MSFVQRSPFGIELHAGLAGNLRSRSTKVLGEVFHHIAEGVDLIKKLGAFAEKHTTEQTREARCALTSRALEIGGIEWGRVRNGSMMFGMLAERSQQSRQGVGETAAEIRRNPKCLAGFFQASILAQFHRFIQRNTQHVV